MSESNDEIYREMVLDMLEVVGNNVADSMLTHISHDDLQLYGEIAYNFANKKIRRTYRTAKSDVDSIMGLIIYASHIGQDVRGMLMNVADIAARRIGRQFLSYLDSEYPRLVRRELRKQRALEKAEQKRQKRERKKIKKKLEKQAKDATKRAKKLAKQQLEKQKNRKRNTFCKNDIEFITQEDIEDIPTEDLTFIKMDLGIFCLDKDSFKNMIKYSNDQKVRGNCKPPVEGKPLECENFYPINIGRNVYINEKNYNDILKNHLEKRKFTLRNKRIVDFTTGLHMMSEKSGKDDVFDLVPDNYDIIEAKKQVSKKLKKIEKSIKKSIKKITVKTLKAECKKKGIRGYSKLKKAELVKKCLGKESPVQKSMTVKELRAECKKKGIRGYSKLKKAELVKKCK